MNKHLGILISLIIINAIYYSTPSYAGINFPGKNVRSMARDIITLDEYVRKFRKLNINNVAAVSETQKRIAKDIEAIEHTKFREELRKFNMKMENFAEKLKELMRKQKILSEDTFRNAMAGLKKEQRELGMEYGRIKNRFGIYGAGVKIQAEILQKRSLKR